MLSFISKGKLFRVNGGDPAEIKCCFIEKYISNIEEIRKNKEWKSVGTGARFINSNSFFQNETTGGEISVSGIASDNNGGFIYSAVFDGNMAVYRNDGSGDDGVVLRKNGTGVLGLDVSPDGSKIITAGGVGAPEIHIAIIDTGKSEIQFITEGESADANPSFSKTEPGIVYYDSRGIGVSAKNVFIGYSPRAIFRYDISAGSLDELIADGSRDYMKPKTDGVGNLYYIRRPYVKNGRAKMSAKDIISAPWKFLKAIFGWMDFFTRKYSGQALNTTGSNPARTRTISDKELFIEGNLINVEKTLRANRAAGEKYPGCAPRSWELMRRGADERESLVKKGVMDYCVADDGIYYSNGARIMRLSPDFSSDEPVCEAELAQSLTWV